MKSLLLIPMIWSAGSAVAQSHDGHHEHHHHHEPAETPPVEDHSTMDHSTMDHSQMNHSPTPEASELRDPHAYSGGFTQHQHPYLTPGMPPHMHDGDNIFWTFGMEKLETSFAKDKAPYQSYEARAWVGDSFDKLLLLGEGEVFDGKLEESETELLWAHAVSPYWDTTLGVRYDAGSEPGKGYLSAGIRGLAPYWFETSLAAFIGKEGDLGIKGEAEYEWLFTQRLILVPRLAFELKDLTRADEDESHPHQSYAAGLRLRYEISRQFAPYIGVEWTRLVQDDLSSPTLGRGLAGVKFWL